MQAKKSVKLEDMFTVRFAEKSVSVDKDTDRLWVWGNIAGYPQNTVFIKRVTQSKQSDRIVSVDELLPMAVVHSPESIDTETYKENWIKLGYIKGDKEKAKTSLKKFVEREIKNDGIVYSIDNGYLDRMATITNLSNKFEKAGITK